MTALVPPRRSTRYSAEKAGAECWRCPLQGKNVIPPTEASGKTRLIIVGEAPGRIDVARGQLWEGPSGKLLRQALDENSFDEGEAHLTASILCRPESEDDVKRALPCCAPRLARELAIYPDATILTMGTPPAKVLLGKGGLKVRGFVWRVTRAIEAKHVEAAVRRIGRLEEQGAAAKSISKAYDVRALLEARYLLADRVVIPTVHPSFLLQGAEAWGPVMKVDINRAIRWSRKPFRLWDEGPFEVVSTVKRAKAALSSMGPTVTVDIETDGTDPMRASITCVGICDVGNLDNIVLLSPWKAAFAPVLKAALKKRTVVTHNGPSFDQVCLGQHGTTYGACDDTLIAHHAFASHLPKSLAHVASVYCDTGPWKAKFKTKGAEEKGIAGFGVKAEDLPEYCAADVRLDAICWLAMQPDLERERAVYEKDMAMAAFCRRMQIAGILVDDAKRREVSKKLRFRAAGLLGEMRRLVKKRSFDPNKYGDIREALYTKFNVPVGVGGKPGKSGLPSTAAGVLEALRSNGTRAGTLCDLVLRWRSSTNVREKFLEAIDFSKTGRVHPSWKSFGTVTGRLSCIARGELVEVARDVERYPKGVPIEDVREGDFVYGYTADNRLVLRRVLKAWKTGRRRVVRVSWLGAGRQHKGHVDLTADHLVRLTDGRWVAAGELQYGDNVMALSRNVSTCGYARLYATGYAKDIREHVFINEQLTGQVHEHVHHSNHRKLDNRPENLKGMTSKEHRAHHSRNASDELRKKRSIAGKRRWAAGESPLRPMRGEETANWLKLTEHEIEDALKANDWSITKTARALGHDFDSFKRHVVLEGFDLKELKFKNRAGRMKQMQAMAAHARNVRLRQYKPKLENNHMVTRVELLLGETDVYDLQVEEIANFIVGELCVHNCAQPNLQNIPRAKESAEGQVRAMYVARKGYKLVYFDLKQSEARAAAYVSGDDAFILNCERGDVHTENAKVLFPDAIDALTNDVKGEGKVYRDITKNVNFGILYGAEAMTVFAFLLSKGFNVSLGDVEMMLGAVRSAYWRYYDFCDERIEQCRRHGHLRSLLLGRIRWFGWHPRPTEVMNFSVQSFIADLMNMRLLETEPLLPQGVRMIAQVHDACITEVPVGLVSDVRAIMTEVWARPILVPGNGRKFVMPIDLKDGERMSDF